MKKITLIKQKIAQLFTLSKRKQFVLVTCILTIAMVSTHFFFDALHLEVLVFLIGLAYVFSAIALRENLRGWEFITLLTLPAYYTGAVFLFYFLLPGRWLTRLPIAALYAVGMYTILLTENIHNVAAERNIQLLRAANTVGFLLSVLTNLLLIHTFLSLRIPFYFNVAAAVIIIFPLVFQALWSMELSPEISKNVWWGSGVITAVIAQMVLIFSFWPINTTIEALFITTVFYSLVGMTQQYLVGRLFPKTTREYFSWIIIAFVFIIVITRWS